MAKNVTTARGVNLDMDTLVEMAKRPLNYVDPKSTITPMESPQKKIAINMRGFMPAQSSIPAPIVEKTEEPVQVEHPQESAKSTDTRTMAEMTGLRIDKAKTIRVKPGAEVKSGDGASLSEDITNRITGNLKKSHEKATKNTVLDDLDDGIET